MDDQDNRNFDAPATLPFPRAVDVANFDLKGRVVACVGFQDQLFQADLQQAGAEVRLPDADQVEVLVVDAAATDSNSLRECLPEPVMQRLQQGDIQLVGKTQLQSLLDDPQENIRSLYSRSMIAELLDLPVSTIRSWQRRGLIQPVNKVSQLPYFDFEEVLAAKQIATLVELGVEPKTIEKNIRQFASWLPDFQRPLNQLSILVDGKTILLRQAGGLVEPGGQRRLDFDHHALPIQDRDLEEAGHILPFDGNQAIELGPQSSMDEYVELAEQLEAGGDLRDAIEVYRSLQLAFGPDPDTCLRIGELLFRMGDSEGARERYFFAIELDETMVEARAALGCVLAQLGQDEHAISALRGALEYHPEYADVHFQLARLYQNASNFEQAEKHWSRFLALSPTGPWAEEARSQLQYLSEATPE